MFIWDALGSFTAFENSFPFSVDALYFCRTFSLDTFTTVEYHLSHDVLIIEVHHVFERNRLFETDITF